MNEKIISITQKPAGWFVMITGQVTGWGPFVTKEEAIIFSTAPPPTLLQPRFVSLLSVAAHKGQRVFLRYMTFSGDESSRLFDPYGIVYHQGYWYTAGYCHLREELRTFRIDRIVDIEQRDQSFERPIDFDALQHVHTVLANLPGTYPVEVVLQATMEQVRQVLSPATGSFEETASGVIWRREVYDFDSVAHLLLRLDFPVTIRQPVELREKMRQLAEKALRISSS